MLLLAVLHRKENRHHLQPISLSLSLNIWVVY